jgi:hypothetical protein
MQSKRKSVPTMFGTVAHITHITHIVEHITFRKLYIITGRFKITQFLGKCRYKGGSRVRRQLSLEAGVSRWYYKTLKLHIYCYYTNVMQKYSS